jgi:5'-nucleotidase
MSVPPLIVISNDDGIRAPGLAALATAMTGLGDLMVVAPDRERSAQSHAITLMHPLRAKQIQPSWWAVDGTPVDCVYLATHSLAPRQPALCISGINDGYNLGSDFYYSGTVAAAVEGTLRGIPSIAVSLERGPDDGFARAARFARTLAEQVLAEGLPRHSLLNVNVPNHGELKGHRFTHLGERLYRDQVEVRQDPRGREYYWIGGPPIDPVAGMPRPEREHDTDGWVVGENLISVTPLRLDLTDEALLARLSSWHLAS